MSGPLLITSPVEITYNNEKPELDCPKEILGPPRGELRAKAQFASCLKSVENTTTYKCVCPSLPNLAFSYNPDEIEGKRVMDIWKRYISKKTEFIKTNSQPSVLDHIINYMPFSLESPTWRDVDPQSDSPVLNPVAACHCRNETNSEMDFHKRVISKESPTWRDVNPSSTVN